MRQTFCITFNCREQKVNKNGTAPIEMTIIINGKRTLISLDRKEAPSDFQKKVKSKKKNNLQEYLEQIREKINSIQVEMMKENIAITTENVKEWYKSGGRKRRSIQTLFEDYDVILKSRLKSGELSDKQYKRYLLSFESFLSHTGLNKDNDIDVIEPHHIELFKAKLLETYKDSTAQSYMKKIRTVIDYAFKTGRVNKDCFCGVKLPTPLPKREYLSDENIEKLKNKTISIERISRVRDLFVFQMSCGLSYADLSGVDELLAKDGIYYIKGNRVKTGIEYTTVVLPDGVDVWNKYNGKLPILSNQRLNSYAKELQDICGIDQELTTHIFRKTFATMMLNKGVSISNVAKMMGHSNTTITEKHYAMVKDDALLKEVSGVI